MKVEAKGLTETTEKLKALSARLRDLKPVMEVAAEDTRTLIDDSFDQQASPGGAPWAPHSPKTIASRAKRGRSGRVLIDTGRLRGSIATQSTSKSFTFGTNVGYGGVHQIGGRRVPARPFLPVESDGSRFRLMTTGSAAAHWSRIREMVKRYLITGEIG